MKVARNALLSLPLPLGEGRGEGNGHGEQRLSSPGVALVAMAVSPLSLNSDRRGVAGERVADESSRRVARLAADPAYAGTSFGTPACI
jgi:hypothetical protein